VRSPQRSWASLIDRFIFMRAVIQRVIKGKVSINKDVRASIEKGLIILLGIEKEDTQEKADRLAKKIVNMRIFGDQEEKMNLSLIDMADKQSLFLNLL